MKIQNLQFAGYEFFEDKSIAIRLETAGAVFPVVYSVVNLTGEIAPYLRHYTDEFPEYDID